MGSAALVAGAEDRKYPYQAIVEIDGEYVRSGPGQSFYPTDKLKKGDKVTVHRHDPGGWCMIAPPPGSFSWIRSDYVQRSGESGGVLKANNVVVHIGSALNPDEFTTIQGNLSIRLEGLFTAMSFDPQLMPFGQAFQYWLVVAGLLTANILVISFVASLLIHRGACSP